MTQTYSNLENVDASTATVDGASYNLLYSNAGGKYTLTNTSDGAAYADTLISSAQLLALNSAPQTIVPAPGAGKFLLFKQAFFYMPYNSIAYVADASDDLNIRYTNGTGQAVAFIEATGFLTATATQYRFANPATAAASVSTHGAPVENSPLVLFMANSEITTGNSPLYVRTFYSVVTIADLV